MTTSRTAPTAQPEARRRTSAAERLGVGEQLNSSHGSFELVLSPVILALIGLWLDRSVWHTTPWCTVTFAVIGFAGAVVKLYYGYRVRMDELGAERVAGRAGGHR